MSVKHKFKYKPYKKFGHPNLFVLQYEIAYAYFYIPRK